jgi:hypothetical protein
MYLLVATKLVDKIISLGMQSVYSRVPGVQHCMLQLCNLDI